MIRLKILDTDWKVYLHPEDTFSRKYGDSDAAFTLVSKQEIHFDSGELSPDIVRHELWHAFRASLLTHSAALDSEAEEEISAELFAVHADKMLRMSRALLKELKSESTD